MRPIPIPILTYHQIAQAPARGAPMRSLYVSPSAFALQMQTLSLLGYQGLSMTALMPYLQGEKTGMVVGITFDDGYVNNLENAATVLKKFNFSSTCYVVSALLGKTNVWDNALGIAPAPLMDIDQLQQWIASGQEIGSHTQHHVDLTTTDTPNQPVGNSQQPDYSLATAKYEHPAILLSLRALCARAHRYCQSRRICGCNNHCAWEGSRWRQRF